MLKPPLLFTALLLIAACGDSSESTSSDSQGQPSTPADTAAPDLSGGVDASGIVDSGQALLKAIQDIVLAAGDEATDGEAIAQAIVAVYPTLTVSGSGVPADPSTISLYVNLVNSKDLAGPDNPWLVAVAVMDNAGTCVGGGVYGFPLPTETIESASPTACSAGFVADRIGELI